MFTESISSPIVQINDEHIENYGVELYIKREDLTDPYISGNKYRKLKYNLIHAAENGFDTLLTFGGAYSNHIHAVAYAGFKFGFKTIGIVRGEETKPLNSTLVDAASFGMDFHYISRTEYRRKDEPDFIDWLNTSYGNFYLIPEGGSNALAVEGCTEILSDATDYYHHICCACGTGGTIAGIIAGLNGEKRIWGFPALKNGTYLLIDLDALPPLAKSNVASLDSNAALVSDIPFRLAAANVPILTACSNVKLISSGIRSGFFKYLAIFPSLLISSF